MLTWPGLAQFYDKPLTPQIILVHDPTKPGAHEDYSRLARLSFDSTAKEMEVSQKAIDMLDLIDEVQSYNSGAPVIPIRPGMLFVASPGTAKCTVY